VLATADDALERLPELLADRPEDGPAAPEQQAAAQPTEQLPAPPEPKPKPQTPPEPVAEPAPPPPEPGFDGDDIGEGVLRVERRPKGGSS
jgi:hypothetical protein